MRREPKLVTYGSPSWGNIQSSTYLKSQLQCKHALRVAAEAVRVQWFIDDLDGKAVVLLVDLNIQTSGKTASNKVSSMEIRVKDYTAAFRVLNRAPGDTVFVEMESRESNTTSTNEIQALMITKCRILVPSSKQLPYSFSFRPRNGSQARDFINQRLDQNERRWAARWHRPKLLIVLASICGSLAHSSDFLLDTGTKYSRLCFSVQANQSGLF